MQSAGKYETLIRSLLSHSELWHTLWNDWDTNLVIIKKVLAEFIENDSLYMELMDADEFLAWSVRMRGPQTHVADVTNHIPQDTDAIRSELPDSGDRIHNNYITPNPGVSNNVGSNIPPLRADPLQSQSITHRTSFTKDNIVENSETISTSFRSEDLKAIKGLAKRIKLFEERGRAALSALDQETDKMITLVRNAPERSDKRAGTDYSLRCHRNLVWFQSSKQENQLK